MKRMKRFLTVLLALGLLGLCGCGQAAPTQEPAPAEAPAEAAAVEAPALEAILTEIHERMQPGTAGSSLTAAELAVLLLDWSMQTDMDASSVRAAVESFRAPMSDLEKTGLALQLASVSAAVDRLLSEEGAGLLDDIGGPEGTLWPWENAPTRLIDALCDAAGVNEVLYEPKA